ncbi:hypothetical protein DY000_02055445 [Brassica cretica]|uniref:Uncharacterized protein n=1 Tax=Brassica cretica TaxID=69181 RepID=A0ABQ7ACI3_BRACR|nr:hypothetical protein DY000_02055445 [Brassica cretica]
MFQQRQMQDMKRKSTEELKAFVEISCTTSPNHLVSVRKAYCLLLDSSLGEHTVGSEEAQLHNASNSSSPISLAVSIGEGLKQATDYCRKRVGDRRGRLGSDALLM